MRFSALGLSMLAIVALSACDTGPELPPAWAAYEPGLTEVADASACTSQAGAVVERLSEHPCFEGSPPVPVAGLVPYSVRSPLWSDGSGKARLLAIPAGASATVGFGGALELPPGTVIVKEFVDGNRKLETRVIARVDEDTWTAHTYVWLESGDDALRNDDGVELPLADGGVWDVPSIADCYACHTDAAQIALGLRVDQLNEEVDYEDGAANQLATLAHLGWLDVEDLEPPDALPRLADPMDEGEPIEDRARAYLASNCAHCHRPGSTGGGQLDLRTVAPLTALCGARPERGDPWDGEGAFLTPGRADRSVLHYRMASTDPFWRMPPLGTREVDEPAAALIARWIDGMTSCE